MLQTKIIETRGRPKKQETRTLAPIYKQKFSDNSAIIHACSLIYVFEVFISTKNEKRVGHKDGGFTIYDKIDHTYCFETLEKSLQEWGMSYMLQKPQLKQLVRLLPAIGPKVILKEIIQLVDHIVQSKQSGQDEIQIVSRMCDPAAGQRMNIQYPYMRFVPSSLKDLKLEKTEKWDSSINFNQLVCQRVATLWKPLIKIIVHTILNSLQVKIQNKYFKPFFSDAQNPYQTYIGQLNLQQIADLVQNQQDLQKYRKESENQSPRQAYEGFRKFRQVQNSENQRSLLAIVKPPQQQEFVPVKPSLMRPIIAVPNSKKDTPVKSQINLQSDFELKIEQPNESNKRRLFLIGQSPQTEKNYTDNSFKLVKAECLKSQVLQEQQDSVNDEEIM